MARSKKVTGSDGIHQLRINCPGCEHPHVVPTEGPKGWTWNGSYDLPTISPSLLVRYYDDENRVHETCHSFVRNGSIEFLNDCTHALAGQTVPLPEITTDE